jgi:hypothetical protein
LHDQNDLLPYFTKLAHPNGLCLKGEWQITEENPYSGLFKINSHAQIIARASVALSETTAGHQRAFGLAGKLFPTIETSVVTKTANFFLVDDLGGTYAQHYTDVELTNEPKVSKTWAVITNLAYALKLSSTFKAEDQNPGIRQLYEIAEAGRNPLLEELKTPRWMRVRAIDTQKKVDAADFRNELTVNPNNGHLFFEVAVADLIVKGEKQWSKIGTIDFSESVASESCDHRLHFHHPQWRTDLNSK